MSTETYDNDLDDNADEDQRGSNAVREQRAQIKRLEKELAEHKEARERAATAERKLAFLEAGINPTDPKAKYFVKGYEGELTAEAIKAEATAAGLLEPDSVPDGEMGAHDRMGAAASAGGDVGGVQKNEIVSKIGSAESREEVIALAQQGGMRLTEQ